MSNILQIALIFTPLLILLWLANVAEEEYHGDRPPGPLGRLGYALVFIVQLFLFLGGILLHAGFTLMEQQSQIADLFAQLGFDPTRYESFTLITIGLWLPALIGMLLLLPSVRGQLARVLPIDPQSPLQTISLAMTMFIFTNMLLTVGIGLGNLAGMLEAEQNPLARVTFTLIALWLQQLFTALVAIVGVGWLTRRTLAASLQRLRIVVPTWEQVGAGVGIGFFMILLTGILQYVSVSVLGLEVDQDVQALTEQLLGSLFTTPFGIITLGLAAAIGEEPLFRGALQPRFGIVLTSLLFAAVHGNYGLSVSTLFVFVLGLVLGWVRNRHNTSTTMIAHAVYNSSIGLIGYLSIQGLEG